MEGIKKLPALQDWLAQNWPGIALDIVRQGIDGPYRRSIMLMKDVIAALQNVQDAPKFYSTDFCHQYVQYGGFGNVWGIVTADPDGHILPIAIGHQVGEESAESWAWFLGKVSEQFPDFELGSLIMDRDKGGLEATKFELNF